MGSAFSQIMIRQRANNWRSTQTVHWRFIGLTWGVKSGSLEQSRKRPEPFPENIFIQGREAHKSARRRQTSRWSSGRVRFWKKSEKKWRQAVKTSKFLCRKTGAATWLIQMLLNFGKVDWTDCMTASCFDVMGVAGAKSGFARNPRQFRALKYADFKPIPS